MSLELIKSCKALQMSPTQKSVLMAVAWYASDDGEFWGSVFTICEHTCLSERAVRKTLHDLVSMGLLAAEIRSGTSTKYILNPCKPCTPAPDAPLHDMHPTPARDAPPPLHLVHPTPAPGAPNKQLPTNTATRDKQVSTRAGARGTRLADDWQPSQTLSAWALSEQKTWSAQHLARVIEGFCDYWRAMPGAKGCKADWDATFRNWVRREKPLFNKPQTTGNTLADHNRAVAQEALRRAQERNRLNGEHDA